MMKNIIQKRYFRKHNYRNNISESILLLEKLIFINFNLGYFVLNKEKT